MIAAASLNHMPVYDNHSTRALHANIHTNGTHKNNNNNITLTFIGLHNTTQRTLMQNEEGSASKDKSNVLKQTSFNE
jgi:hypothetical protein